MNQISPLQMAELSIGWHLDQLEHLFNEVDPCTPSKGGVNELFTAAFAALETALFDMHVRYNFESTISNEDYEGNGKGHAMTVIQDLICRYNIHRSEINTIYGELARIADSPT